MANVRKIMILAYCAGGRVVHSYGRLIPHEFPITDLQQISGPDGIGRVTCTVSRGIARFVRSGGVLESDGVTQTRNGATAALLVKYSRFSVPIWSHLHFAHCPHVSIGSESNRQLP